MNKLSIIAVGTMLGFTAACTTTDPFTGEQRISRTAGGVGLGAVAGAALGTLAGGDDRRNALIGAGIGAIAGGGIGVYMDRQQAELRDQLQGTGVSVTRQGDNIILNMPSNITFPTDGDQIQPGFVPTLDSVTLVLKKYNQTYIDVYGHTDSTGSDSYNQALSQRRAQAVANYLTGRAIAPQRFAVQGYGETIPIGDNGTEAGRAQNRRVEIKLVPIS